MKTIVKQLPKVELHLHLDGSVRVSTVAELLNISYEEAYSQMVCDKNTRSLTDYLKKFELPVMVMQTKENLKRITKELLEDLKEEHVIYVELRFAPLLHTKEGLSQKEVVEAIIEGIKEVTGITCNLILCCTRDNLENEKNLETIEVAKKFLNHGVVALDLAGDESKYPTNLFQKLFEKAKKLGVPYTIHAGEASSYRSILEALHLGAVRIGHGISSIQNKELMNVLKENEILLEICPQSNVDTNIVVEKKEHPIKQLYANMLVSVNTDNRTVSNITLTEEYEDLMKVLDFTVEDIKTCNLNAIKCSFLKEEEKEQFRKQIEEGYCDTTYRS